VVAGDEVPVAAVFEELLHDATIKTVLAANAPNARYLRCVRTGNPPSP
jgi:hypothetical protein